MYKWNVFCQCINSCCQHFNDLVWGLLSPFVACAASPTRQVFQLKPGEVKPEAGRVQIYAEMPLHLELSRVTKPFKFWKLQIGCKLIKLTFEYIRSFQVRRTTCVVGVDHVFVDLTKPKYSLAPLQWVFGKLVRPWIQWNRFWPESLAYCHCTPSSGMSPAPMLFVL